MRERSPAINAFTAEEVGGGGGAVLYKDSVSGFTMTRKEVNKRVANVGVARRTIYRTKDI